MKELLLAIYDRFYKPDVPESLNREIEDCHRQLIDALSKNDRKVLLRLIDDKDHIAEQLSIDSFIRGFPMAWQLATEIRIYERTHPIPADPLALRPKGGDRE